MFSVDRFLNEKGALRVQFNSWANIENLSNNLSGNKKIFLYINLLGAKSLQMPSLGDVLMDEGKRKAWQLKKKRKEK